MQPALHALPEAPHNHRGQHQQQHRQHAVVLPPRQAPKLAGFRRDRTRASTIMRPPVAATAERWRRSPPPVRWRSPRTAAARYTGSPGSAAWAPARSHRTAPRRPAGLRQWTQARPSHSRRARAGRPETYCHSDSKRQICGAHATASTMKIMVAMRPARISLALSALGRRGLTKSIVTSVVAELKVLAIDDMIAAKNPTMTAPRPAARAGHRQLRSTRTRPERAAVRPPVAHAKTGLARR